MFAAYWNSATRGHDEFSYILGADTFTHAREVLPFSAHRAPAPDPTVNLLKVRQRNDVSRSEVRQQLLMSNGCMFFEYRADGGALQGGMRVDFCLILADEAI